MSKVSIQTGFSNIQDDATFRRYLSDFASTSADVINGELEFDLNIRSQSKTVTFSSANTDLGIQHTLNRRNLRFIVAGKNAACDIYHGAASDTANLIYLRSTVAQVTVNLILI